MHQTFTLICSSAHFHIGTWTPKWPIAARVPPEDIFDDTCGYFHPFSWCENRVFSGDQWTFPFSFGATEIAYFILEVKPSRTVNHGDQIRYFKPNQAVSKP